MGKLHSKLSSKHRQSPEGGVSASNFMCNPREYESISSYKKKNMCRDVKSDNCVLKDQGRIKNKTVQARKPSNNEHTRSPGQKRHEVLEDNGQEWLFTICQSDNDNEDMSSFLHGVSKAIEASVTPASDTTLKIKIVLTSSDEKKHSPFEETERPVGRVYCAGENIERRNHYLDLTGIENFSSKFDNEDTPIKSSSHKLLSARQHHPVVTSDNCTLPETPQLNSLKTKPVRREEQSGRLYEQPSPSHCPFSHFKHRPNAPVHRSNSKRMRPLDHTSPQRPMCCSGNSGRDCDVLCHLQPPLCPSLVRHHHLHEHHHHHHHHYHAA